MKSYLICCFMIAFVASFCFISCNAPREDSQQIQGIYQVSVIDALLQGDYDGDITIKALASKGDFGLGTFNGLDGEMIALDGEFYQVKSDGYVYAITDTMKTPFAVVTNFETDTSVRLNQVSDYLKLTEMIDTLLPTNNIFYAVKIEGLFKSLKTRSVPKQERPYRKLALVADEQQVFEYENISGTLIGFRCPDFVKGVNVPGYHLHFLSADKQKGGHLLACELQHAVLEIDSIHNFKIDLSKSADFYQQDLSVDSHKELKKVEQDN